MAVMVKDPEMAALIPHIVEQLRLENVTPEERDALAEIFDDLWPLMVAEADRLRTEPKRK
uniref:PWI domain-containing protein n=1 Tax=Anopheles coluzzii TaxID=1518534 RepID=A0A6E8W698_ANOCL